MSDKNNIVKMWEVTISGTFRTPKAGEYEEFENVVGYVPYVDEEFRDQAVRKRYAAIWIGRNKNYKGQTIKTMREVHIDSAVVVQKEQFSFVGKNITEMKIGRAHV